MIKTPLVPIQFQNGGGGGKGLVNPVPVPSRGKLLTAFIFVAVVRNARQKSIANSSKVVCLQAFFLFMMGQ